MNIYIRIICFVGLVLLQGCRNKEQFYQTDVLVIGGTSGGISAGIQSARLNVATLIVEETQWLGGMLTAQGVSAIDGNHNLPSGIWNEFRNNLRIHYGGAKALETGWVSNTQFEPHIGDSIFKAMAAAENQLKVIYGYHVSDVLKDGNKVTGAVFLNNKNEKLTVFARIVIDATDLGDGLSLAGAEYDLGMESRWTTGEEMAPELANDIIQDLTWVAVLKDYGKDADRTIPKPKRYNPGIFKGSCAMTVDSVLIDCDKMINYARLPKNKYLINWPRHGNDFYLNVVEMNYKQRIKELDKAKQRTLEFVYYIQTELGYKNLGLADDEFPTSDHLAMAPYHREGRRLRGIQRLTINHVLNKYETDPLYRTGISVGDYPVDHHHDCNPDAPKIIFPPVPSFNIPMGCLIPETVDGLVVADKAISVSNIINGATRLQPCVLLTGQAAGVIAALSVLENTTPRNLNIRKVQQKLLDSGAYLMPLYDVKPEDKAFQAIQRSTASGILKVMGEPHQWANRTWFFPDSTLTVAEFTEGLNAFNKNVIIEPNKYFLTIQKTDELISAVVGYNVRKKLEEIWTNSIGSDFIPDRFILRRELAIVVDALIRPFETQSLGFDGNYKELNMQFTDTLLWN
ncbi:MAG TPA: FAD-dependent oxidoreductase [Draconibacterium sp.]|nr:FAD-dependent oxidoreductase [Draconibacterium sp.]